MKGKTHDLNHDLTFYAHTFKCVCHCIRLMLGVLGVYNFAIRTEVRPNEDSGVDILKQNLHMFGTTYMSIQNSRVLPWMCVTVHLNFYFVLYWNNDDQRTHLLCQNSTYKRLMSELLNRH